MQPRLFNATCFLILLALLVSIFFAWGRIAVAQTHVRDAEQLRETLLVRVTDPIQVPDQVTFVAAPEPEPTPVVVEEAETVPVVIQTPLPTRVHLNVPFTSQAPEKNWDQPWQDACEEASILMLDAYEKGYSLSPLFARDEILKQVAWQTDKNLGGSIDVIDVRSAAASYMRLTENDFRIIRYPDVDELKAELAAKKPIIALADGKQLPNPYFSEGGPDYHALLIIGYDDATQEFITNDPGTQHGKDFRYAYDDLIGALRDWNDGDVANGTPVVLVRH